MPVTIQRVIESVREVEQNSERLVLIVGQPGSGKSKVMRELARMRGWVYVDCRTLITEEFLELVPKVRSQEAPQYIGKALDKVQADTILLDSTQILFAPILQIAPLELLKQLSRKRPVVAAWPGTYSDGVLTYAQAGQKETKQYEAGNLKVIQI